MQDLVLKSSRIRSRILALGYGSGRNGAHFGSSLSLVELVNAIYFLNTSGHDIKFILSKGHGALGLFACLEEYGFMSASTVDTFEQNGSNIFAHAHKSKKHNIEFSGGSLGLGLPYTVGKAIVNKASKNKICVLLGDGECDEGIVWESLMLAAHLNLTNLTVIVDRNGMQSDGTKKTILDQGSLVEKFNAFGFETYEINGHDFEQILPAINASSIKPKAIVANTIKGKGVSFMENNPLWHHGILSEEQLVQATREVIN